MDAKQLAELVHDMRNAQREYFRTRSGDALAKSKGLERQVDQAVKGVLTESRQRALFDDEG